MPDKLRTYTVYATKLMLPIKLLSKENLIKHFKYEAEDHSIRVKAHSRDEAECEANERFNKDIDENVFWFEIIDVLDLNQTELH